jgi:hypothetical protein
VRPVDLVLERANNIRGADSAWLVSCPLPDHGQGRGDRNPSLSVTEGDDGRALVHCLAGCATDEVVKALGLEMRNLFAADQREIKLMPTYSHTSATLQPCTLEAYAEAKGLPVAFLEGLGLSDRKYQGRSAVRIPYRDAGGHEACVRFRTALEKTEASDDRFRWRTGNKAILYGLWRLEAIRETGYVVLVEGESDAQTLWFHGIPALGVPGASSWKREWAQHLEGLERIYAVIEPDGGGQTFRETLASTAPFRDRLYLVSLGEHKDANGLHLLNGDVFGERIAAALEDAVALIELEREEAAVAAREAWAECKELAREPDILERFARDFSALGVAGESRLGKLVYLALTSRLLDERPVSLAVKGPSSGGKSHTVEQALRFFPRTAYYALTAMSEHALAYSDEPLSHRFLVIYEAAGMNSDFQTYLIRSLLSEGRIRYETVEKTSEGMRPRLIEREGPTGLIVTTTAASLHKENETRMFSATVTDTQDQTRRIMAALADETGRQEPDLSPWLALQGWLEAAERSVTVPYAAELAASVPPIAVRLRRDFKAVLNLVRAHALLHQASRERDAEGRVVAAIDDYARVREIVADLVSEGVEAAVPPTVRETVSVLKTLHAEGGEPVTITGLAKNLRLDKSSTWRRVRSAMEPGYVKNLEDRKGRPARLVPGDSLPADVEILPPPERLQGCTVAGVHQGVNEHNTSERGRGKGENKTPPTPSGTTATVQPRQREVFAL